MRSLPSRNACTVFSQILSKENRLARRVQLRIVIDCGDVNWPPSIELRSLCTKIHTPEWATNCPPSFAFCLSTALLSLNTTLFTGALRNGRRVWVAGSEEIGT